MANTTLRTRIVLRNDSTANWLANDSQVLLKGEVGIEFLESGSPKIKIGDGIKAWSELPYFGGDSELRSAKVFQVTAEGDTTDDAAITNAVGATALQTGDLAIVKRAIAGDKFQYTGYAYNGNEWAAMDGNYNAENVYFAKDLITTSAVGNITLTNGQATIAAEGKNLKQVFETIFVKEKNPTVTQPSVSVSLSGAGAREVGTKVTPSYNATFNKGSYEYGPDTGLAATWAVKDSRNEEGTAAAGSFSELEVGDNTNYTVTATATYGAGATPLTNIGNPYAAGAAEAVLGKNSDSASTATVYGVQKAASAAQTAADNAKAAADGAKSAADAAQATADAAMPKAGGTFTGPVTLNGAPTSDLHAATKKYVDDKTAALSSATHFIGIKETLPASANSGDICIVGKKEYIYDGTKWQELGDETLYVQKEEGKGLSSNDFTDALLTKLNGVEEGAQKNVQSDWNATSGDAFIKNKPDALKNPTALSFGSKTYDGSEAVTLTAEDIGAITQHQDISGKQDKLTFDGVYNASSNKVATVSTVNSAINGLAAIAKTGNVNDLVQTEGDVLIFYCGTSNTVM